MSLVQTVQTAGSPATRHSGQRQERSKPRQLNLAAVGMPGEQEVGVNSAECEVGSVPEDDVKAIGDSVDGELAVERVGEVESGDSDLVSQENGAGVRQGDNRGSVEQSGPGRGVDVAAGSEGPPRQPGELAEEVAKVLAFARPIAGRDLQVVAGEEKKVRLFGSDEVEDMALVLTDGVGLNVGENDDAKRRADGLAPQLVASDLDGVRARRRTRGFPRRRRLPR